MINLNHYFDMSKIVPTSIRFELAQQENRIVSVKMHDFKKATLRALNSNHFDYIGPPIQINDYHFSFHTDICIENLELCRLGEGSWEKVCKLSEQRV